MKPKVLGKITQLKLTKALQDELPRLVTGPGGYQSTFRRIRDSIQNINGEPIAHVISKDLENLREWAYRDDAGSWQDWARGALAHNGLLPAR